MPLLALSLTGWAGAVGILILWRRWGWRESIAASFAVDMMRAKTQPAPNARQLETPTVLERGSYEKVVKAADVEEMKKFAYVYFFCRA